MNNLPVLPVLLVLMMVEDDIATGDMLIYLPLCRYVSWL
jgi:hypothetical protein